MQKHTLISGCSTPIHCNKVTKYAPKAETAVLVRRGAWDITRDAVHTDGWDAP